MPFMHVLIGLTHPSSSLVSEALFYHVCVMLLCMCRLTSLQEEQLLRVLLLSVQVLQQFLPLDFASLSKEDHSLLSSFLQLVTQLLNWDFKQQQKMFRTNPEAVTIRLRPPKCYGPTFLDVSFLYLFFRLLSKVKSSENDFHHVVQCLVQLSSLTKPVFSMGEEEEQYLANFVGGLLEYVGSR